jgi:hypothetical protein
MTPQAAIVCIAAKIVMCIHGPRPDLMTGAALNSHKLEIFFDLP